MVRVVVQDTIRNRQWVGGNSESGFSVGRDRENLVALEDSRFVSRRHLYIEPIEGGWQLTVDQRASEVTVDGAAVRPGGVAILKPISQVRLAEYVLTVVAEEDERLSKADAAAEDINGLQRDLHAAVLRKLDLRREDSSENRATAESLDTINEFIDSLLHGDFRGRIVDSQPTRQRLLCGVFENRLILMEGAEDSSLDGLGAVEVPGLNVALEEEALGFTQRLRTRLEERGLEVNTATVEDPAGYEACVEEVVAATPDNIQFYMIARHLKKVVCDMVYGLGPLQDLLDTPSISEIMIVSPELVFVERAGQLLRSNRAFLGDDALMAVIERIVAPLGRRVDRSQPLVDARLPDGSRVNAIIPPLALKGPSLTIRRFPKHRIQVSDLVEWGSLTPAAARLLQAAVQSRCNIVVAGGTGSGKTTLLNALSSFIPEVERLVTIEDAAELRLDQEHVVSLESKPANVEGQGEYTIRDLVKNALRMRPDRILVGECRGEEAFDMLQAMNTGHDGSMTSAHSNSSEDAVSRIETMCLMAVDVPLQAIRHQVCQTIDLIVHISRLPGGRRMVGQVTEVLGVHPQTEQPEFRDIFKSVGAPGSEELRPTGYIPNFLPRAVERGLIGEREWFAAGANA